MTLLARAGALLTPQRARAAVGPIGVDFSLDSVHLVQLEVSPGKPPGVRARASLPFDCARSEVLGSAHRFRATLRRALAAAPFQGRKVVVAVPSGMFRTVSVNYRASGNDTEAVLEAMKERLDGELTDYVLDYLPVRNLSKKDERLALVAVAEKSAIVDFLELLRHAGLQAEALEIGPVAISRLVGAMSAERGNDNVLVINSGQRASYLTLISGDDLLFDQEIAFGENGLVQHAAQTLDMAESMIRDHLRESGIESRRARDDDLGATMAEILKPQFLKLVDGIKRVCLYAAAETRGGAVERAYLLGSVARWPGTEELLSTLTGFDVSKIPDPLAIFPAAEDAAGNTLAAAAPEIAVATGAALRGVTAGG